MFLANFIRYVEKLLGPQARDGTSALMRSLISECVDRRRYILHDIGSGRKSLYDLFAFGIFFIQGPSNGREISIKCFCYGLGIVSVTSSFIPSQVCFIFFVLLKNSLWWMRLRYFYICSIKEICFMVSLRSYIFCIAFPFPLYTFIGKIMPLVIQGFILRLASFLDNFLTGAMIQGLHSEF